MAQHGHSRWLRTVARTVFPLENLTKQERNFFDPDDVLITVRAGKPRMIS